MLFNKTEGPSVLTARIGYKCDRLGHGLAKGERAQKDTNRQGSQMAPNVPQDSKYHKGLQWAKGPTELNAQTG